MKVGRLWLLAALATALSGTARAQDKVPAGTAPPDASAPTLSVAPTPAVTPTPNPEQTRKPEQTPAAPLKPAEPPATAGKPSEAPAAKAKPAPTTTDAVVLDAAALDAIIGRSVKSQTGEDMGRIVDVLVPTTGPVRAAVIDFGGFLGVGSRKIAVDWKALNFTDVGKSGNVIVALTRNQVRMAPEFRQGDPIVILEPTKPSATGKEGVQPTAEPAAPPASAPPPAAPPSNDRK